MRNPTWSRQRHPGLLASHYVALLLLFYHARPMIVHVASSVSPSRTTQPLFYPGIQAILASPRRIREREGGRERSSSRGVVPVVRCDTVQTFSLSPRLRPTYPVYIYTRIDYRGVSGTYMRLCMCARVYVYGGTAFSARGSGSSHDNPMGVSHRFRGIGFDCCYLDPADEDSGIHAGGVAQTYRVASQPRLSPRRESDGEPSERTPSSRALKFPSISHRLPVVLTFSSPRTSRFILPYLVLFKRLYHRDAFLFLLPSPPVSARSISTPRDGRATVRRASLRNSRNVTMTRVSR